MLLYAVTDRTWVGKQTLMEQVKDSLEGGITFLQLREKGMKEEELLAEAKEMKRLAAAYGVPFVVNDNVDIAIACGADGVHVGQSDMEAGLARKKLGPDKIIGVTCRCVKDAVKAEKAGADYLGVGAVFASSTKQTASVIAREELEAICKAVSIPVVAIGGIKEENLMTLKGSGVSGAAIVSGIYGQEDIKGACKRLLGLAKAVTEG